MKGKNGKYFLFISAVTFMLGLLLGSFYGKSLLDYLHTPPPSSSTNFSHKEGVLQIESASLSPNGLKTVEKVRNPENDNPWEYLVLKDPDGQNGIQLTSHRALGEPWGSISEKNWDPWGEYMYMTTTVDGTPDVYIFNTNGKRFSNNEYFLLASKLGISNINNMHEPNWQAPGQLVIFVNDKKLPVDIMDAKKEIITKTNGGD